MPNHTSSWWYLLRLIISIFWLLGSLLRSSAFVSSHRGKWNLPVDALRGGSDERTFPASAERSRQHRPASLLGTTQLASTTTPDTEETSLSSSSQSKQASVILADNDEFIKPDPDRRKYRSIRLWNNLQVLLVSAPDSDVEAGAVHVQAGHMDDPPEYPGLAHFHEHMLFLGTDKYPDENEYEAFLNQHGGSSNAYTDMEDTNYYFSITPHQEDGEDEDDEESSDDEDEASEALVGSLDRLAQFFIAPRFDTSMVERELRAIDSEYRNAFTSDAWRQFQLLKNAANQEHPFSKFGCGNYETLTQGGKIVNGTYSEPGQSSPAQGALQEFWNKYYVTTNMRLCVVGRGCFGCSARGSGRNVWAAAVLGCPAKKG
jgi:hypothetical protein